MEITEEQVPLMYSNEKLKMLIESGLPIKEVFKTYIKSLNYKQISDFPNNARGMQWFNTSEPLSFKHHLRGKLVLLDFFTYCCINCMHILPDLKEIEQTFSIEDGLVVIGVHSAKFDNEKDATNVANAVLRYNIEHPVVNDEQAHMWTQCEVHCWPTLLLIAPGGRPLVMLMGEGHRDTLKVYIREFLHYYSKEITHEPLAIIEIGKTTNATLPNTNKHRGGLLFPGKLRHWEDRLCISDSGNNRLVIVDEKNGKKVLVGSRNGNMGFRDGDLATALFNQPQGVCFLDRETILVADTENHAIRRVDLRTNSVATIAGNGCQSSDRAGGALGSLQGISSPWDVDVYTTQDNKKVVLVAMAGTHQIWAIFLEDTQWWKGKVYRAGAVVRIAGSGREENRNNNYPNNAAFAQPSGVTVDQDLQVAYIADSESSTVRKLSLVDGKVTGVVGGDKNPHNLFAFGDIDGVGHEAKLQHCLGVALSTSSNVFVADTYNHKIKLINMATNQIATIKNAPKFNEPAGLSQSADGRLFVADTNNHLVKICTLNTEMTEVVSFEDLPLDGVDVLTEEDSVDRVGTVANSKMYVYKKLEVGNDVNVTFEVKLDGLHWTEGAPHKWSANCQSRVEVELAPSSGNIIEETFSLNLKQCQTKSQEKELETNVDISLTVFTCLKDLCFNKKFVVRLPITQKIIDNNDEIEKIKVTINIGQDSVLLS